MDALFWAMLFAFFWPFLSALVMLVWGSAGLWYDDLMDDHYGLPKLRYIPPSDD
jgi:hypothetical protein